MERCRAAASQAPAASTHVAGIGPSWLDRRLPDVLRPYAGLPIDQVFAKGDVAILSAKTLEAVGSDHLPVLVEFSLLGGKPEDDAVTATAMVQFRIEQRIDDSAEWQRHVRSASAS